MSVIDRRQLFGAFALLVATAGAQAQEKVMDQSLIDAVNARDLDQVRARIAAGSPLEPRDGNGRTPLLLATRANLPTIADALIDAGADVNAKDALQDTPFLFAGAEGRDAILRAILATGRANIRDTNRYGGNALIPAAEKGHPETVRILIEAGLDVDHVNNLGWTALLEAVILGEGGAVHKRIVELLLAAGADVSIADRDGVTALAHARARGQQDIATLIEAAGRR